MLRIGSMKNRIEILRQTIEPDGQGGLKKEKPRRIATVWAAILKPRFWDGDSGKGPTTAITQGIQIRPLKAIDTDCIIRYRNTNYEILDIEHNTDSYILTCQAIKKR